MEGEYVEARLVRAGDVILLRGAWRLVINAYLHHLSPYNKIDTIGETENKKAIPLHEKVSLQLMVRRKSAVETKQVHFCAAIEEMAVLTNAIKEYAESNDLPVKVRLVNTNFEIDSVVVQRGCHERMMASFNRLKNAIDAVKKP